MGVIGSSGEGCGQFNAPTGLAIDARGSLIVADWGNSRLQVYSGCAVGGLVPDVTQSSHQWYSSRSKSIHFDSNYFKWMYIENENSKSTRVNKLQKVDLCLVVDRR